MDMEVNRLSNGATAINVALSRKVDRAPASYSELKLERAWLVMRENFAQNTRFSVEGLNQGRRSPEGDDDVVWPKHLLF
jgi:hypothetical protein